VLRCPKANQAEKVGEVDEPFRFKDLVLREGLAAVLFVEERMEAAVDAFGQHQPGHILGKLEFEVDANR
jgi:hypothetical protein